MDEITQKLVAENLRKPEGDIGREVAERMNKENALMNRRTIRNLKISPGDNILEIGMGNGFFVKEILSVHNSVNYTGCDYSESMIAEAEKMNMQFIKNGRARFLLATADNMPFPDGAFNKIFTINTLYFWDHPEKVLSEFHRVLKPGGLLLVTYTPKWILDDIPFVKYGFNVYTNDEVRKMITGNGFKIIGFAEETELQPDIPELSPKSASVVITSELI